MWAELIGVALGLDSGKPVIYLWNLAQGKRALQVFRKSRFFPSFSHFWRMKKITLVGHDLKRF
jgi:hypothetical protein